MKYPQLVSMPSAVQDWLDQQLEARGIDAVVYTRYIVSLLQRDSLDPPEDTVLTSNNTKEGGRRGQAGRKRGRKEDCLGVGDCEQLKRSAAVQCLLSASDQKCGIEKLVDELCMKLKEIESESKNSVYSALTKQPLLPDYSSQDEAQKYYAAFPPLSGNFSAPATSDIQLTSQATSVWSSGTKATLAVLGGKKVGASTTVLAEKATARKGWKGNKENVHSNKDGNMSWKEVGRENSKSREYLREKFLPHKKDTSCRLAWDMEGNVDESCIVGVGKMRNDSGASSCERAVSPRRLYERKTDSPFPLSEELHPTNLSESHSAAKKVLEDNNLAQLIAKFDHSIEALWTPNELDRSRSPGLLPTELERNVELPVHASPFPDTRSVYLGNQFIPSGTNITSSIWSGNEENLSLEQIVNHCSPFMSSRSQCPNVDNSLLDYVAWNKVDALPSVMASLPCGLGYDLGDFTQKWSDVESLSSLENYSQFGKIFGNNFIGFQECLDSSVVADGLHGSFSTLNHSKKDSSFTEVIPKSTLDNLYTDLDSRMESMNANLSKEHLPLRESEEEDLLTSARTHFRPIKQESVESQKNHVTGYADGTTFLIPDGLEVLPFQRSQSGALYLESDEPAKYMEFKEKELYGSRSRADIAEHFSITSEFIPKFRIQQNEKCCQTEEDNAGLAGDEEIHTKRSRQDTCSSSTSEHFFFPGDDQQVEKALDSLSDHEQPVNKSCTSCHIAEVNYLAPFLQSDFACLEHGENPALNREAPSTDSREVSQAWSEELKTCGECSNFRMWKINSSTTVGQPGKMELWNADQSPRTLSDIWSSSSDMACKPCEKCEAVPSVCHFTSRNGLNLQSLREELSQDGEQLLSDLSCMQHTFLGSEWLDDSDCLEEEGTDDVNRPSAQKFQCISPCGAIDDQEMEMYADDGVYSRSVPDNLLAKKNVISHFETKSVDDFFSKCLRSALPAKLLLLPKMETEWRLNERPFNTKANPKDRKRRHSASQRASSLAPRDLACVLPRAQTACVKGVACSSFFASAVEAFRPVTL